tara:strand:+ start:2352 stop:2939 length:588 start_codon:yes stop_codon:yes gene_type:complete
VLEKFGISKTIRRIEMETNESVGVVDYISAPKDGKDQWFMPVVLDGSGTKIKFYCKFDPQVQVGDRVLVSYGPERRGNATAYKVSRPDVDINQDVSRPSGGASATPSAPTHNKSTALPEDMIAVGLAGRLTECIFTMHHDKGIQLKDPAKDIASWITIAISGYKQATNKNAVKEIQEVFPDAVPVDDDIDDEVPF